MREDIKHAAELIKKGELVAFPTETVYGLGADATNGEACVKIYQLKGRPLDNPLIVHGFCREQLETIAIFNEDAIKLAIFWPGPLTMVLPRKQEAKIADCVTANLPTIAVRIPAHDIALKLIEESECLIAAPSANKSGSLSPTTSSHVLENFSREEVFILETELKNKYGLESTIIDLSTDIPTILRYGFITPAAIESVLGKKVAFASKNSTVKAPGMLHKHYSPKTKLRINAAELRENEVGLNFGGSKLAGDFCLNLSENSDLAEAATNLFYMLHQLDYYARIHNKDFITVAPIPNSGIGLAINDRLQRAAE
jgi:L-threonylcarbamoyladenylate synthase